MNDGAPALLRRMRARRGYVLNYHRLMAAHDPALLGAYDAFYAALTLEGRDMAPRTREIVWIALLAAAGQGQGRIHIERARVLGMADAEIAAAAALAAGCVGALPPQDEALALAACAAVRGRPGAIEAAAVRALEAGASEAALTEALSLVMIPCGLASFFRAATAWRGAEKAGAALLASHAPGLHAALCDFHQALLIRPRAIPAPGRALVLAVAAALAGRIDLGLGACARIAREDEAAALLGVFRAWPSLAFVAGRWAADIPDFGAGARYAALLRGAAPACPAADLHLAGLLFHAAQQDQDAVRLHLLAAFDHGASAGAVAETITYLRLCGTGAAFIAAIDTWAALAGPIPAPFAEDPP